MPHKRNPARHSPAARRANSVKAACCPKAANYARGLCKSCYGKQIYQTKPGLKARLRRQRLAREFSITPGEYRVMFEAQDGVCAICSFPPKTKGLNIDHSHKTGLIRGLVCHACNRGMGRFRDDADRLDSAAKYLRQRDW